MSESVIVVVNGRNRRVYARVYKRKSYIQRFLNYCVKKEEEKCTEKDGGSFIPTGVEYSNSFPGLYAYQITYAPAN